MLSRLKNDLKRADLGKPDLTKSSLTSKYPLSGDYLAEVRRLCERGMEDGWLCPGENGESRSSRVAGTSAWFPFSIEASYLAGEHEAHASPKGEVGLCFPVGGKPKYCGEEPGWVVFQPGSKHRPEASGGTMFMLSFLPDGAIERGVTVRKRRSTGTTRKSSGSGSSRSKRGSAPAARRASGGRSN
jgi:hypothetical protein